MGTKPDDEREGVPLTNLDQPLFDGADATVDATAAEVERRLDDLGIPREERERPPGARSRG